MSNLIIEAEKFEKEYADNTGINVEELRKMGRVVVKCNLNCDYISCKGFNSISRNNAEEDNRTIILPLPPRRKSRREKLAQPAPNHR